MATEEKQISQEVMDMSKAADAFIPAIEVKGNEGTVVVPREAYTNYLYDDLLNDAVLKRLNDKNTVFNAGVTHSVGHKALEVFKQNPEVEEVNATFKLHGRDQFEVRIKRSQETSAPGSDTKIVNYGVVTTGVKVAAARHKSGELHLVREELKAAALKAFGE